MWTGTWRDPRFSPPGDARPENSLTGQLFMVNDGNTTAITVPAANGKARFWRNTTVATLPAGGTATMPNGTLGYEWDADIDNGLRPSGLIALSSTTRAVNGMLLDYGSTFGPGTVTHKLSLYRHASGALVFGAGTVQWAWGLDASHDRGSLPADLRMQQATVNLFADMGAQPGTLQVQDGLVPATASTDARAAGLDDHLAGKRRLDRRRHVDHHLGHRGRFGRRPRRRRRSVDRRRRDLVAGGGNLVRGRSAGR